ncbi:MAG: DUF86 domain-containing protein [SAR324 cluster bacterium]|nr:DUF86 domain-containing protein [SAR324 cluster bacterium]
MLVETKKHLYDIQQAIVDIEKFVESKDYVEFAQDRLLQAGVERKFEIIGEALNRIKKSDTETVERIHDFKKIISFRNVISHGYDVVDTEIVWDAINENLNRLKLEVEKLLNSPE